MMTIGTVVWSFPMLILVEIKFNLLMADDLLMSDL